MKNEIENRELEEKLREENEFLKMKLMLEHGAKFGGEGMLSAIMEHAFLQGIIAVENGVDPYVQETIFERIGKPTHFLSHDHYSDEEVLAKWHELQLLFEQHGIELRCADPDADGRAMYRIATEEFFQVQAVHLKLEGFTACYTWEKK